MELKKYQKAVVNDLTHYLACVNRSENLTSAWHEYWFRKDINVGLGGVPPYNNTIAKVPHVCMKVPTGGGKTFIACSSIKKIFDSMPLDKAKVVVWLVPSDAILTQTIQNLSDVNHPYRQRLDADFSGRVGVYTKEQLLSGQNFSPDTVDGMLTICILSYAALRINSRKKDIRKVYQENGNLLKFTGYAENKDALLNNTPDTALIQIIRRLYPVVIVDESHNAGSALSIEMLENLNPSFILDLTATPRSNSNILSYVDARELKKENMVKLPVIVYNRNSRQDVIRDALQLRASLEQEAIAEEQKGGNYIRPIILFQAQPNISTDSSTFNKIRSMLLEMGIPKEEIAIKTSEINELSNQNLLSSECPIRYIITVNALKEGWDCPFAYILASLANKTSQVDVEQIVGRILRQPYTTQHSSPLLNLSYVLTSSNDFHATLDNIVTGLNKSGFSSKDYRVAQNQTAFIETEPSLQQESGKQNSIMPDSQTTSYHSNSDDFSDISTEKMKRALDQVQHEPPAHIAIMLRDAHKQNDAYLDEASSTTDLVGGELGSMLNQSKILPQHKHILKELKIPQLFYKTTPDLFGKNYTLLEPENLSYGFSLANQNAQISFELSTGDMYQVDIQDEGDAIPKYRRVPKDDSLYLREYLANLPPEQKIKSCVTSISKLINRNNRYAATEISDYVNRIIKNMTEHELAAMETALPIYANKIATKIYALEKIYREEQFYKWIDAGKITAQDHYELPKLITPANSINSIPKSLYDAERDDMNGFERKLVDILVTLDNILWWHRIIERKGFRINAFMNHYPDFMIMTKRGKILLIEAKGDYLDGDDSKSKLRLGRKWQDLAGQNYRYFMVFDKKALEQEGAYTLDGIVEILQDL